MSYEKQTKFKRPKHAPAATIYNPNGAGSRVKVSSMDNSTNVVNVNSEQLFEQIADAIKSGVTDIAGRQELLAAVRAMSHEKKGATFVQRYAEFMSLAANHM